MLGQSNPLGLSSAGSTETAKSGATTSMPRGDWDGPPSRLPGRTRKPTAILLAARVESSWFRGSSASKDHAAETAQREGEIDAADRRHRGELGPDDRKAGIAIEHGLRESDEMRRRGDDPHRILQ